MNILKFITRPFTSPSRLSKLPVGTFCKSKSQLFNSKETIEDWQYCKMISEELKNSNVNKAVSLLFEVLMMLLRATLTNKF